MVDKDAFDRFFSQPLLWFVVSVVLLGVLVDVQFVTVDHRSLAQSELFALLDNLLIGILVSFVFYFLIVHVPEQQRRKRLRESFLRYYLSIKEALIWQIVFASRAAGRLDLDTRQEQIDKLMNSKQRSLVVEKPTKVGTHS